MKTTIVILLILVVIFFSKYIINGLIHPGVDGVKVVSPVVSGTLTSNGFKMLIFYKPYFLIGKKNWKFCENFDPFFLNEINLGIHNTGDGYGEISNSPRNFLVEDVGNKKRIYLDDDRAIIYLSSFADNSGDYSTFDICMNDGNNGTVK